MLPKEHSEQMIKNLGFNQKKMIDRLKMERQEAPVTDTPKIGTYDTR